MRWFLVLALVFLAVCENWGALATLVAIYLVHLVMK